MQRARSCDPPGRSQPPSVLPAPWKVRPVGPDRPHQSAEIQALSPFQPISKAMFIALALRARSGTASTGWRRARTVTGPDETPSGSPAWSSSAAPVAIGQSAPPPLRRQHPAGDGHGRRAHRRGCRDGPAGLRRRPYRERSASRRRSPLPRPDPRAARRLGRPLGTRSSPRSATGGSAVRDARQRVVETVGSWASVRVITGSSRPFRRDMECPGTC